VRALHSCTCLSLIWRENTRPRWRMRHAAIKKVENNAWRAVCKKKTEERARSIEMAITPTPQLALNLTHAGRLRLSYVECPEMSTVPCRPISRDSRAWPGSTPSHAITQRAHLHVFAAAMHAAEPFTRPATQSTTSPTVKHARSNPIRNIDTDQIKPC
jgi:hypothetical protein